MTTNDPSSDRERRISFLLRESRRKRELPEFRNLLAQAIKVPEESLRFLPLDFSDSITTQYTEFYQHTKDPREDIHVTWADALSMDDVISRMAVHVEPINLFVMFHHSSHMGIMELDARTVFKNAVRIMLTSRDTIICFSEDCQRGATLDFYEEGPTGATFECTAWGEYRFVLQRCLMEVGNKGILKLWQGSRPSRFSN